MMVTTIFANANQLVDVLGKVFGLAGQFLAVIWALFIMGFARLGLEVTPSSEQMAQATLRNELFLLQVLALAVLVAIVVMLVVLARLIFQWRLRRS